MGGACSYSTNPKLEADLRAELSYIAGQTSDRLSIGALSMIVPVYHSEIAATRVRGRVITFGIAISFWVNQQIVSFIDSHPFPTFLVFAIFCFAMTVIVFFFYPETKNTHLEQNDMVKHKRIFVRQALEDRRRNSNRFPEQSSTIINQYELQLQIEEICLINIQIQMLKEIILC